LVSAIVGSTPTPGTFMKNKFFVLLQNPSNGVRFALVDEDCYSVAMFRTVDEARNAADKTLFGSSGYYEVYSTDGEI
jgi:hypothetical protein